MNCPRRLYAGQSDDFWREDNTCSYCGSLNPETFMSRLEAGDVQLSPTDKTYKVYLRNREGGRPFMQTYRTDSDRTGDASKHTWETRETSQMKFYFDHLGESQMQRFVELYNDKKLNVFFTRLPSFMSYTPI